MNIWEHMKSKKTLLDRSRFAYFVCLGTLEISEITAEPQLSCIYVYLGTLETSKRTAELQLFCIFCISGNT